MDGRPRRSVLYVPADNPRALAKARVLPADCLILDLEDAVAPSAKDDARLLVERAFAEGGFGGREVVLRINGAGTGWHAADVDLARKLCPDAVLLPKVDGADALRRLAEGLGDGLRGLWAMIETPSAVLDAAGIAACAQKLPLRALVMGTNDLVRETGVSMERERMALVPWLMTCVAAARAAGIAVIDGVFNDIADVEGFRAECRQGRILGMDGKTLIHPSQIDPANEIFAPTEEEIREAEEIVAAFARPENAQRGVVRLNGRMVERLHLEMARELLRRASAIGRTGARDGA